MSNWTYYNLPCDKETTEIIWEQLRKIWEQIDGCANLETEQSYQKLERAIINETTEEISTNTLKRICGRMKSGKISRPKLDTIAHFIFNPTMYKESNWDFLLENIDEPCDLGVTGIIQALDYPVGTRLKVYYGMDKMLGLKKVDTALYQVISTQNIRSLQTDTDLLRINVLSEGQPLGNIPLTRNNEPIGFYQGGAYTIRKIEIQEPLND